MAIPPKHNWKNGQRMSEYRERIVKRHGKIQRQDTETIAIRWKTDILRELPRRRKECEEL